MTQKIQLSTIGVILAGGVLIFMLALKTPSSFPHGTSFQVGEGESLGSISTRLQNEHIISSALLFRGWISLLGRDKNIGLGEYYFTNEIPLGLVIAKFIHGPDQPLIVVTIPEGKTTEEIADAFQKALPVFSTGTFKTLVSKENADGYLFPSTYYPLPSFKEKDIVDLMRSTFEKEYSKNFKSVPFPKLVSTERKVISLAAILEGEAKTPEDMKIVSGILQKRLENGMKLQVDAAKSTYTTKGIPDTPIDNPGLVAIEAVFHPTSSPYLYYLTGRDGKMYYSKTFEEHKLNIQRHL